MNEELRQSVTDAVIESPTTAKIVSAGTALIGFSTWREFIDLAPGVVASVVGLVCTIILFFISRKKMKMQMEEIELSKKLYQMQIKKLEEEIEGNNGRSNK